MANIPGRRLAYPVCKGVANELFVVATASDFKVAQQLQHRTKAAKARLQLSQVISSNHQIVGSWIVVTMPDQAHEKLANCIKNIVTILDSANWTFNGEPLYYDEVGSAGECRASAQMAANADVKLYRRQALPCPGPVGEDGAA